MNQPTYTFDELLLPTGAKNLSGEISRTYYFAGQSVHIYKPLALVVGETTHRVVNQFGDVYCVPAVGRHGCYVIWRSRNPTTPIDF